LRLVLNGAQKNCGKKGHFQRGKWRKDSAKGFLYVRTILFEGSSGERGAQDFAGCSPPTQERIGEGRDKR